MQGDLAGRGDLVEDHVAGRLHTVADQAAPVLVGAVDGGAAQDEQATDTGTRAARSRRLR
jgi:hypothetical protein